MLSEIKDAFKQKKEEQELANQAAGKPLEDMLGDSLSLSDVVKAIAEVREPFNDNFFMQIYGFRVSPICLHIRLPPPALFFIEHGSPFLLSLLAEPPRERTDTKPDKPNYGKDFAYQARTVCASIVSPKIDLESLRKLPILITQLVYSRIIDAIAPPNIVGLMRVFNNLIKDEDRKSHLLQLYLMAKNNHTSALIYLFPNYAQMNPYVTAALEFMIHVIGHEYDQRMKQLELKAMSGGAMRQTVTSSLGLSQK